MDTKTELLSQLKLRSEKLQCMRIARQLCYSRDVINQLKEADSESELNRIMHMARTGELK